MARKVQAPHLMIYGVYIAILSLVFGMAGLPGVWTILFQHCFMGMARSENIVTIPTVIHDDDVALLARLKQSVDEQAEAMSQFMFTLDVMMRAIKTRYAAQKQLYTGLWWDSVARTLELEPERRDLYVDFFYRIGV